MGIVQNTATVTIASGAAGLSAAVFLGAKVPMAIDMPAGWVAASLTFQGSSDGVTYSDVHDEFGVEYVVVPVAGKRATIPPMDAMRLGPYIKIRSGTAAVPVNQTAERLLTVTTRALSGPF